MKTVSGAVVSSKPVSLSKAAKILSKFALADNGASPAFVAYLKRASDSFDELVQLHKELRGSGSERKSKKHRSGNGDVEEPFDSVTVYGEGQGRDSGIGMRKKDVKEKKAGADGKKDEAVLVNHIVEGKDSKKKKKNVMGKSEEKDNGVLKMEEQSIRGISNSETVDNSVESKKRKKELKKIGKAASEERRSNGAVEIEKESSHGGHGIVNGEQVENDMKNEGFERMKNKTMNKENEVEKTENKIADLRNQRYGNGDFDGVGNDNAGEKKRHKMKQIHEGEGRDGESKVENKNEKKGSKKRKSEEIADGGVTDSVEKRMLKKKKKGKSEGDN